MGVLWVVGLCLPTTAIHAISHVTFPALYFNIVSYMRLLFQLKGQYSGFPPENLLSPVVGWKGSPPAVKHVFFFVTGAGHRPASD